MEQALHSSTRVFPLHAPRRPRRTRRFPIEFLRIPSCAFVVQKPYPTESAGMKSALGSTASQPSEAGMNVASEDESPQSSCDAPAKIMRSLKRANSASTG